MPAPASPSSSPEATDEVRAKPGLPLFRPEALAYQRERAWGEASVAPPRWVNALLLLALMATAGLLLLAATASYTRKVRVQAVLAHAEAPAIVAATEPGVLTELAVRAGDAVVTGQLLARISTDRMQAGQSLAARADEDEAARLQALASEREGVRAQVRAQEQQSRARLAALDLEIGQLEREQAAQQVRVTELERQAQRLRQLARERFVSELQLQQKEDEVAEQSVKLASLGRNRSALERERAKLLTETPLLAAQMQARLAQIEREAALARRDRRKLSGERDYELRASTAARIGRVLASPGQTLSLGEAVLSLERAESEILAELYLPSRSAGLVRPGQSVRLAISAFPYERFGHVTAVITEVGSSVLTAKDLEQARVPVLVQEPVFRLRARLAKAFITAHGQDYPLRSGLTGSADILLERRPLWGLLFDPLLRLKGQL